MLPWLGLSIDDVASVMNLTLVYGIGNIILVLAAPTPHCLLADNNISNGVKHIRCRTGYKRYRVTCEAINRGMITTIASRNSYSEWLLSK